MIVSHRLATLRELETCYSYDDALNMSEILHVDAYNAHVQRAAARR